MNELNTIAMVTVLLVGLAIGYWLKKSINASQSDAITQQVKNDSATELATVRERMRGLESEMHKLNEQLNQSTSYNQNAQARILELSTSEAEKARELQVVNARNQELARDFETITDRLKNVSELLAQEQSRCAGLAADNERIAPLSEQVASLEQDNVRHQTMISSLREDVGRVQAELQAEKDAHTLVRNESGNMIEQLRLTIADVSNRLRNTSELLAQEQSRCAGLAVDNERIAPLSEQVARLEQDNARHQMTLSSLREDVGRVQAELQAEKDAHKLVRTESAQTSELLKTATIEVSIQQSQLTELKTRLESERKQSEEKLALLLEAKDALTNQFKSLASDILEEKSKRFTEQNQNNLGQLLDPLKTRLQEFQGKIELFYDTEGKQRSALAQQVTQLMDLNKTLSDDAKNLTLALKGSSKSQGNWGELILERVLEASGLRKGEEYDVQESHTREDGSRAQPDVVIHLPENRHLVVDAKVSLTAYEEYASAENDAERQAALRRHLESIRSHIKGLSERNYQSLYGLQSLDFVLMFIPIEPAFMLGVTQDDKLFMDAWGKNVLLVSPSTLLFVVRTVAHLWRQEAQNRNAQDIAKRGAELYDRLFAFVSDLERVGDRLRQAQESYKDAFAKLSTNKGNVIRQAEMLKELGVKPTKALPSHLLEAAGAVTDE
ncbi:DNA recombination protein RmuC [Limnohabitans sp. JirII-29]|uniref:DNA recombination protein RmuC n=1 Tax=Limnohabitans sp. JirII-29 TaxID=1835756 RepID=UPI001E31FBF1|nr:DNA recombination protein RmuC [Limnohabitans sp. JirII-29]